jgi:hypothetical protein
VIGETAAAVEQVEIGCAGGVVGARHVLRRVDQIVEREAELLRVGLHLLGAVLGISVGVIGVDRDDREAFLLVLARELGECLLHVLHVRAMVAPEHHEQPARAREVA